ncbi:MAG: hypothetical protein ABDH18_01355 [Aquificaceae bacterium]
MDGLFLPTGETDCTLRPKFKRAFLTAKDEVKDTQTPSGFRYLIANLRISSVQSSGFLRGENP